MMAWRVGGALSALVMLAACGGDSEVSGPATGAESSIETAIDSAAVSESQGASAAAGGLDLSPLPVSTAALGAFPYFTLPNGYVRTSEETHDFFAFPFWVNGGFRSVEGRVHMAMIEAEDGGRFSKLELQRNLEAVITRVGGVKISEAPVPSEALAALGDQIISDTATGMGDIYNNPVATYVIRRADRTIWVHLDAGSSSAGLTVAETAPLVVTAGLLGPEQLASALEADGRVAIQVNFAVDSADILPDSLGQIDAVADLLKAQPDLRLAVEGHTDSTGSAARNRTLSTARARSVVASLMAAGIANRRLQPQGFGPDRPVADNATEDGRARNRRVELVAL